MNRFVHSTATRIALALAGLTSAACQSIEPAELPSNPAPRLVSTTELAGRLRLDRHAIDDGGRIVLSAAADGGEILLFAETTVVTVNGTPFTTSTPLERRGGEAWLTKDDAASIESLWNAATVTERVPWTPPVLTPFVPLSPRPTATTLAPALRGPYSDLPSPAECRAWGVALNRPWRFIVIHHSATESGSASQFDVSHKKRGWDGLGYDFVIGNGNGSGDGAVEVGFRWLKQKDGAHAGPNSPRNRDGIGICLVGDFTRTRPTAAQMRALSRLCNFLSGYCGIPRENYLLHGDVRQTACPGPFFPRDFLDAVRPSRTVATDPHDR